MTTPEQIQKWREEATKAWVSDGLIDVGQPAHTAYIGGYLRAKQETEQAIKDARKQALEEAVALCQYADFHDGNRTVTEKKLEELLND